MVTGSTHHFFSPEGHLGVIETTVVVAARGTVYKAVAMM
jgi:hypothetical protein